MPAGTQASVSRPFAFGPQAWPRSRCLRLAGSVLSMGRLAAVGSHPSCAGGGGAREVDEFQKVHNTAVDETRNLHK